MTVCVHRMINACNHICPLEHQLDCRTVLQYFHLGPPLRYLQIQWQDIRGKIEHVWRDTWEPCTERARTVMVIIGLEYIDRWGHETYVVHACREAAPVCPLTRDIWARK